MCLFWFATLVFFTAFFLGQMGGSKMGGQVLWKIYIQLTVEIPWFCIFCFLTCTYVSFSQRWGWRLYYTLFLPFLCRGRVIFYSLQFPVLRVGELRFLIFAPFYIWGGASVFCSLFEISFVQFLRQTYPDDGDYLDESTIEEHRRQVKKCLFVWVRVSSIEIIGIPAVI